MAEKVKARRCSVCDLNWPDHPMYEQCPLGHGPTWIAGDETPMTTDDALKLIKAHRDFEKYYEEREAKKRREAVEDLLASVV